MLVIGLTGGLATGKSTVAGLFEKLGARVLDADKIVHDNLMTGSACYKRIVAEFGPGVLEKKQISRSRLASIVFNDQLKLKKLENIIHPFVRERMTKEIKQCRRRKNVEIMILEVPLLFEAGFQNMADYSIVVTADVENQIKRSRQLTRGDILKRIKAQMPLKYKISLSDETIDNNGNINQTQKQVKVIWQKLLKKVKKERK